MPTPTRPLMTSFLGALDGAFPMSFTEIRPRHTDERVPSSEERDEMRETGWFAIFRSGDYPQAKVTAADIDATVADYMSRRARSPIVLDHLNSDDLKPGAKPGHAVGYIIEARAVDDPTDEYKGQRLLEVRAKVSWWARYATRSGDYRNVSIGLSPVTRGKEKLFQLHHLALLGAAPPAVDGLPEVIFSESSADREIVELSFSKMDGKGSASTTTDGGESMSTIAFADHQKVVEGFERRIATFQEQLDHALEGKASAETEAEAAKAAAAAAKEEAAAIKAEAAAAADKAVVAVEAAREEGRKEGLEQGKIDGQALFAKQQEEQDLKSFCQGLREAGKINDAELAKFPGVLFRLQGEDREVFKSSLEARPGLTGQGPKNFGHEVPKDRAAGAADPVDLTKKAQELVRNEPTRFASVVDAFRHLTEAAAQSGAEDKGGVA